MPRKAKEKELELNTVTKGKKKEVSAKKASKAVSSTKTKKVASSAKTKAVSTKKTKKEAPSAKVTKKTTSTKAKKPVSAKKTTSKKSSAKVAASVPSVVEYYDLPFRYNQTIVRILAQTPNILFIYWDVSDKDKNEYMKKYGSDFLQNTRPYLIITNKTMNYTFEVEINDFANSWYLHINDADCEYKVELGRKFIVNSDESSNSTVSDDFTPYYKNDYLPIVSSNETEMPNDHILFDELGKTVFFKNVKTNILQEKDISSIAFLRKIGKMYHIYDLYKELYKDELISDEFELNLPSSSSSSSFK